jgi:hypothetical protein
MSKLLPVAFVLAAILIIGTVGYIIANQSTISDANAKSIPGHVGTDVAKNNVRVFCENQDLEIISIQELPGLHDTYYHALTPDGVFYVNAETGVVEIATFTDARTTGKDASLNLTEKDAEKIARAFVEKHYGSLSIMENMSLIRSELIDHGTAGREYIFDWNQNLNGIYTLNTTTVSIDPSNGNVTSYSGMMRPLKVPLVSKITQSQAISIATGQFKNIEAAQANASLNVIYKEDGVQVVAWCVIVKGQSADDMVTGGGVAIDAISGEIIYVSPYL